MTAELWSSEGFADSGEAYGDFSDAGEGVFEDYESYGYDRVGDDAGEADEGYSAYSEAITDGAYDTLGDGYTDAQDGYADAYGDVYADAYTDAYTDAFADAFADAYSEAYTDAYADAYGDAGEAWSGDAEAAVLDGYAEGFDFGKAFAQIASGAEKALRDPTVNSIIRTAAPLALTTVGSIYGGPAGGALAGKASDVLLGFLPKPAGVASAPVPGAPAGLPAAGVPGLPGLPGLPGQPAVAAPAAPAPDPTQAIVSRLLGTQEKATVGGVPTGQLMAMLSSLFGRAAAEADAWADAAAVVPGELVGGAS